MRRNRIDNTIREHFRPDSTLTIEILFKLNEPAQEWADVLAKRGVLEYRSDPNYGENIFTSFWRDVPAEIKPRDPLEFWSVFGKVFLPKYPFSLRSFSLDLSVHRDSRIFEQSRDYLEYSRSRNRNFEGAACNWWSLIGPQVQRGQLLQIRG